MNFVEPIRDRKKIAQIKNSIAGTASISRSIVVCCGYQCSFTDIRFVRVACWAFPRCHQQIKRRFWIKEQKRGKRTRKSAWLLYLSIARFESFPPGGSMGCYPVASGALRQGLPVLRGKWFAAKAGRSLRKATTDPHRWTQISRPADFFK